MRRLACLGLVLAASALGSTACSGGSSEGATYTFNENKSPVKVDTPQLRALKKTTDMQACPTSYTSGAPVDGGLPSMVLPCLGGGANVDLAALRGPLVLNFWQQTCTPCRKESPLLQQFAERAAGRVSVLGVDFYDSQPSRAIDFTKALDVTYPQIADPNAATRAVLHIVGVPITLLIDASGRIAYTKAGAIDSLEELSELVKEHLGVSVPLGGAR